MKNRNILAVAALAIAATLPISAQAQSVEEFYKGRDVKIVIGAGLGGSYGLYSQLAAKYLGKYIPGHPNLIVDSQPGAGGLKGLNYMYNAAPKDGSVIAVPHAEVLYWTLLSEDPRFDAKEINWIGRLTSVESIIVTSKGSGVKTLDDAKGKELATGATGLRSHTAVSPSIINKLLGTKFKIVAGYKGTANIFLGMEQGELDAHSGTWPTLRGVQGDKLDAGEIIPIVAMSSERLSYLPDVPAIGEFATPETKAFLEIYASQGFIGRSLGTPPGVPADRVEALRAAYDQMIKDPEFLKEIEENGYIFDPMPGAELQSRIEMIMDVSPEQVEAADKLHQEILDAIGS